MCSAFRPNLLLQQGIDTGDVHTAGPYTLIRRKKGGTDQGRIRGGGGGFVGFVRTPLQLYYYELHVCSTVASYRIYLQKY